MAVVVLLCSFALPAWGQQYYLYEPKPTVPDAKEQAKDGVLVREVPVQEGDTLYGLSRKFSGYGKYYPQILLFNDIKDPNLIYTGDTLKIPLPHGQVPDIPVSSSRPPATGQKHSVKAKKKLSAKAVHLTPKKTVTAAVKTGGEISPELPLAELKKVENGKEQRHAKGRKAADKPIGKVIDRVPAAVQSNPDSNPQKTAAPGGQQLFEKAVKAYKLDDCRTALELFDRYLSDNSGSPLAADASLYKAECYLKLSAQ